LFFVVLGTCARLQAMDRWSALSQIESADNDYAVGLRREVSRYQVLPAVWRRYASPNADWRNPDHALSVAKVVMRERSVEFERRFGRPPTDLEFYILWNAPAQISRASKVVYQRAMRFRNLVARETPSRIVFLDRDQVRRSNPPSLRARKSAEAG
jgi:hypothetical protein